MPLPAPPPPLQTTWLSSGPQLWKTTSLQHRLWSFSLIGYPLRLTSSGKSPWPLGHSSFLHHVCYLHGFCLFRLVNNTNVICFHVMWLMSIFHSRLQLYGWQVPVPHTTMACSRNLMTSLTPKHAIRTHWHIIYVHAEELFSWHWRIIW